MTPLSGEITSMKPMSKINHLASTDNQTKTTTVIFMLKVEYNNITVCAVAQQL